MIANLKAKAAGFDRKRLYTAAAALVIAGAAGNLMQRNAGNTDTAQGLPTPVTTARQSVASVATGALAPIATPTATDEPGPVASAEAIPGNQLSPATTGKPATDAIADATLAPKLTEPAAEADAIMAENAPASAEPATPPLGMAEEVTRSMPEPILAVSEISGPEIDTAPDKLAAADGMTDTSGEPALPTPSCDIAFDAAAQAGALVAITLSAPCNPGEAVEFDNAGLKFSEQLGPEGDLFMLVPVMRQDATIVARFADGRTDSVETTVPDFSDFLRVAVVWKGATGLQLHALEHGADYGEDGHVWAEAPASVEAATAGEGGFVSVLGSTTDGYAADVYTLPAVLMEDDTAPLVSIEAQVMENTCGHEIAGSILRSNDGRAPSVQPLTMAVPDCDNVGQYLVLNNLPQDLKLARN